MTTPDYETGDQFLARMAANHAQLIADVTYFLAVPPPPASRMPKMRSITLWRIAMSIPA